MKTIMIFFMLSVIMIAQPTIKTRAQKPAVGDVYTIYVDVKATNTASVLVTGLDPLKTNITSYIKPLTNVVVKGDTTFGEFSISASDAPQYLTIAVSKTSPNKKPSLLKVVKLTVSPRSTEPAFFDAEEK